MTTIDCNPDEFYRFNCPKLGFSILFVPHSEEDRTRLKSKANEIGMSERDFAQDRILAVMTMAKWSD